jgi:hypothetical protein
MAQGEMRDDEVILHLSELRETANERATDRRTDVETRIECKRIVNALTIAIDAMKVIKGMQ